MTNQEKLMFQIIDAIDRFGTLKYGAGDYDEKYKKEEWQMKAHAVRQEIHVLLTDLKKENYKFGVRLAIEDCSAFASMYAQQARGGDNSGASDHRESAALEIKDSLEDILKEI